MLASLPLLLAAGCGPAQPAEPIIVEKVVVKKIIKEIPVVREVPVEIIKEVVVIKEVPVEVIKEVVVEKEVIVEVLVEVPVEVVKEVFVTPPNSRDAMTFKRIEVQISSAEHPWVIWHANVSPNGLLNQLHLLELNLLTPYKNKGSIRSIVVHSDPEFRVIQFFGDAPDCSEKELETSLLCHLGTLEGEARETAIQDILDELLLKNLLKNLITLTPTTITDRSGEAWEVWYRPDPDCGFKLHKDYFGDGVQGFWLKEFVHNPTLALCVLYSVESVDVTDLQSGVLVEFQPGDVFGLHSTPYPKDGWLDIPEKTDFKGFAHIIRQLIPLLPPPQDEAESPE